MKYLYCTICHMVLVFCIYQVIGWPKRSQWQSYQTKSEYSGLPFQEKLEKINQKVHSLSNWTHKQLTATLTASDSVSAFSPSMLPLSMQLPVRVPCSCLVTSAMWFHPAFTWIIKNSGQLTNNNNKKIMKTLLYSFFSSNNNSIKFCNIVINCLPEDICFLLPTFVPLSLFVCCNLKLV